MLKSQFRHCVEGFAREIRRHAAELDPCDLEVAGRAACEILAGMTATAERDGSDAEPFNQGILVGMAYLGLAFLKASGRNPTGVNRMIDTYPTPGGYFPPGPEPSAN